MLCAAIVLSAALPSGTAIATSSQEQQLHGMINRARSGQGVGNLSLSEKLSRRARRHTDEMADSGTLFHSCLDCGGGRRPASMAENIGVGPSLKAVHQALMDSSGHRENILSSTYHRVGVGVVRRGDRVWVTELFSS